MKNKRILINWFGPLVAFPLLLLSLVFPPVDRWVRANEGPVE